MIQIQPIAVAFLLKMSIHFEGVVSFHFGIEQTSFSSNILQPNIRLNDINAFVSVSGAKCRRCSASMDLASSIEGNDGDDNKKFPMYQINNNDGEDDSKSRNNKLLKQLVDEMPFIQLFTKRKKLPPVQIDDPNLLLYDVFLIVNLTLSISFWVVNRMDFRYLPSALNEGCLFSILWILSGLYHGSFLHSSMDGHYDPFENYIYDTSSNIDHDSNNNRRGGPKAAAMLAFNTYVNAINLRLICALVGAFAQHRKVIVDSSMEQLIPLEIACGLILMTFWRALHSHITPRI